MKEEKLLIRLERAEVPRAPRTNASMPVTMTSTNAKGSNGKKSYLGVIVHRVIDCEAKSDDKSSVHGLVKDANGVAIGEI